MATIPVQVRLPKQLAKTIDDWVKEGKYASRSDAIKTIVAQYQEIERTRLFYKTLLQRSKEAKEKPELLVPLEKISRVSRSCCTLEPQDSSQELTQFSEAEYGTP